MVEDGADAGPEELCRALHPRMVGSLRLYLGDLATAEEIAQDALSRVVERWEEVRRMDHPEAWTWRVAFNLATSSLRRRSAERRARERLGGRPTGDGADDQPDPTDVLLVRSALGALPARQRQAVVLRYFGDLPLAEIGAVMGCATGTVKAHLHKAMTALRAQGFDDDRSAGNDPHPDDVAKETT